MTGPDADVSFGRNVDSPEEITLCGAGKPRPSVNLQRREFLARFCQAAGTSLLPAGLWNFPHFDLPASSPIPAEYHLHPHYRSERPLDAVLLKVQPGSDQFISEKYAAAMEEVLGEWSASLLRSPREMGGLTKILAPDFSGSSLQPEKSTVIRSGPPVVVRRNEFATTTSLRRDAFVGQLESALRSLSKIIVAEFQVTNIQVGGGTPPRVQTRVRYEIVGTGAGFHREQRVGYWQMEWESAAAGELRIRAWQALEETQARSNSPIYVDITGAALGVNASYSAQMQHGADYWRTVIDGASGIDIYGHNGISVADVDGDGFDDFYVCQPAGLPNRLYRNRGDGTFEDITESSGLGILDNTACALFADLSNRGRQDVIVVRAGGPLLFENDAKGKFREKPDAFHFANPPQGTFTGAALADYDCDGWLDIYFCLYAFYQGTGQYRYPAPYFDAENGPPNFLLRNGRDGTFRDVTAGCGLNKNNTRYSFCCGWNDYNRDGWPDLYVVNDFGRKNLYRNNGDGTFTDVAAQAGVEDVGAGMGVSWFDADNDGVEDVYVANMWTAAGERISGLDNFKPDAPKNTRPLYRKHAMGNSLFHNRGADFENVTRASGAGIGRWSWACDAFDFDHDGFADLYVTNGMISSPSRTDLNSFFWRQVVANSPDEAGATHDYEQGWDAINELVRSDGTWSGYERNVFYANNRDGTFSDVSAAAGLDFIEDGRAFALADFDHDGRIEIFLKNRNAPQLRVLKNFVASLPPSIAFRLQGTKGNRDAIGAVITIETSAGRQMRTLQAGSGFLSQHSKEVMFGLGGAKGVIRATIHWPGGSAQELRDLPANHRITVVEGSQAVRSEPFQETASPAPPGAGSPGGETLPEKVETWLLAPVSAPDFSLPDSQSRIRRLAELRGHPALLSLCSIHSKECAGHLNVLQKSFTRLSSQGLKILAVDVPSSSTATDAADSLAPEHLAFPILRGTDDVAAIYNILIRQMFDRHRDLTLPTSFLIDKTGEIVKVYQGAIDAEHLEYDVQHIPETGAERLTRGLPFPGSVATFEVGRNYLSYGAIYFQRGYLDEAQAAFQRAFRDDPSSAEALYGVGSVYLNQNKNSAAREAFERAVKLTASYPGTLPDAWNNLGVIATRENRVADALPCFEAALRLNPNHLLALDNLGNAYREQKRWDDARKVLQRALAVAPNDAEANYSLGMVFAQNNDTDKAYEHLQAALKTRPAYPEALNNLGILYLVTQRRDLAVASFEESIRVAPAFDQAYLNLARVYALEGAREKARGIVLDLLKQHPGHPQAKQMLDQLQ